MVDAFAFHKDQISVLLPAFGQIYVPWSDVAPPPGFVQIWVPPQNYPPPQLSNYF